MHLLKEFIKQIDEVVIAIEAVLSTPSASLKSLKRNLGAADTAVKCCEVEAALKDQLDKGNINTNDLSDLSLLDDSGDMIFSSLGPKLLASVSNKGLTNSGKDSSKNQSDLKSRGKWLEGIDYKENDKVKYNNIEYICLVDHTSSKQNIPPNKKFWNTLDGALDDSVKKLLDSVKGIQDSNLDKEVKDLIKSLIDQFNDLNDGSIKDNSKFFHTGPDGTVYELKIKIDPSAPPIAPRRFAVAINPDNVEMFVGPKSFASDVEVLLNEIKFRIDNQLS